jgi:Protein of unknown function (DUF2795)
LKIISKRNIIHQSGSRGTANRQEFVEGQKKEINLRDYVDPTLLEQLLKELRFPANKNQVVSLVREKGEYRQVVVTLKKIENKMYSNVAEVINACRVF